MALTRPHIAVVQSVEMPLFQKIISENNFRPVPVFVLLAKFTLRFLYSAVNSGTFCRLKHYTSAVRQESPYRLSTF